jgi:hypothetical protein
VMVGRRSPMPHGPMWPYTLAAVLVAVGGSFVFQVLELTRLTPDSFRFLQLASILEMTGSIDALRPTDVVSRQVFVPLMYSPAPAMRSSLLLSSLAPLLGMSALVCFWALSRQALDRVRLAPRPAAGLSALGVLALVSIDRFVYHAAYVNGHMTAAVLVLVLVSGAWFAAVDDDVRWALPAIPAIIGLVLMRAETPLVLGLLLLPVLAAARVPSRVKLLLGGTACTALLLWWGIVLAPMGEYREGAMSPSLGALMVAGGLVVLLVAGRTRVLARLLPALPAIAVAGLVLAVPALIWFEPELMGDTIRATRLNLTGAGLWQSTWLVLVPLLVLATLVRGVPLRGLWATPALGYLPLVIALAFLRGAAYREGPGDSGNRLLMHMLLVAVLYVVLAAGAALGNRASTVDETEDGGVVVGA